MCNNVLCPGGSWRTCPTKLLAVGLQKGEKQPLLDSLAHMQRHLLRLRCITRDLAVWVEYLCCERSISRSRKWRGAPCVAVGVLAAGDEDAPVRHQSGRSIPAVRQQPVGLVGAGVLHVILDWAKSPWEPHTHAHFCFSPLV